MTKVIVIAGGTGILGKAIVTAFEPEYISNEVQLAIISKHAKREETPNRLLFSGDLLSSRDCSYFINKVNQKCGHIDTLINCVGGVGCKPFLKYSISDYDCLFDLNVKTHWMLAKAAIPLMKKQKYGQIITVGSTRAITSAPNKSLYSMTKFALRAMNESINIEFNQYGIYSTLICPGNFKTVSVESIASTIKHIISLPMSANIPIVQIGGQL